MAEIYPSLKEISELKVQPTVGEQHLLIFLMRILDDSFEIFFQPWINGDNPDIVIVNKKSGVLIIEVKDWDLSSYYLDSKGEWRLLKNKAKLKSPRAQVQKYKDNIYNLHIEDLYEESLANEQLYSLVRCAVYFHKADELRIKSFSKNEETKNYKDVSLLGSDSLYDDKFKVFLNNIGFNKTSMDFECKIYDKIKRFLIPSFHALENGKEIFYTDKQKSLIISKPVRQKIKGVAGSGKSFVLAKRAVNAYKRMGKNVLILTFNISLKNYLHDRLSEVRDNFEWSAFHIFNYHHLITTQCNNYGIQIQHGDYENENLFYEVRHKIKRYSAIFIDEIQDFKIEWQKVIVQYFLEENGELVIFGDEKQNIYGRSLENKKIKTVIPGAWNQLNDTHRLSNKISDIAINYQKYFLVNKYELDEMIVQSELDFEGSLEDQIRYYFVNSNINIFDKLYNDIEELKIHPNDLCFISEKKDILRETDFYIRMNKREKTHTTFESKEIYQKLKNEGNERKIDNVERSKKFNFWMNSGKTKLSTIHSFKGWESNNIVLIIENSDQITNAELIYTGITRCKRNLFIVNIGNAFYHKFFEQNKSIFDFFCSYSNKYYMQ